MRRRFLRRLALLQLVLIVMLLSVLGRLWQLQVAPTETSAGAASERTGDPVTEKTLALPAPRGRILDAEGRVLAGNTGRWVLAVDRHAVNRLGERERDRLFARLGRLLDEPPEKLADGIVPCSSPGAPPAPRCFTGSPYGDVPIAEGVGVDVALKVAERSDRFPGVSVRQRDVRDARRPAGAVAGPLLGYVAPASDEQAARPGIDPADLVGKAGLERQYDKELRGRDGSRRVRVDVTGRVTEVLAETPPRPGLDLRTSIDADLQALAERELDQAMAAARERVDDVTGRRYRADSGAVVVLDADTGRIRAMVSRPGYDPDAWRKALRGDGSLLSRATQGEYAPGSTFKVVPTAAALANGTDPDEVLPCPGTMRIGGRTFTNYHSRGYAPMSFERALAVSCDTFFYRVALRMWRDKGVDAITQMARAFGFGTPTGVDLPGEASGHLGTDFPYPGHAALLAIGQGKTTVTPLQLAVAYGALANGGRVLQPRIGAELLDASGRTVRQIRPQQAGRLPLDAAQLEAVRAGLRAAASRGTAADVFEGFDLKRRPIAAKTGTAEVDGSQTTGWLASFDDEHVVVAMIGQGGTGSGACGPVVREIWKALERERR